MAGATYYIMLFLKGVAMGIANVIPGVSGGTIALITGIYERLINALKSFDFKAIQLLFAGKFAQLIRHIDLFFLLAVGSGAMVSIVGLAHLFEYLFESYPVLMWAFFFGLILASVYFVGMTVHRWYAGSIAGLITGTGIAVSIAFLTPASPNAAVWYVFFCGIVAVCSMILPGLSGSFVLLIMGNYLLVLSAISEWDFMILLPLLVGCSVGLLAFSHLLSWLFTQFRDTTLGLLTGFILGSLLLLWPWKAEVHLTDEFGNLIERKGAPIIAGYDWQIPDTWGGSYVSGFTMEAWIALGLVIVGILVIWVMERVAGNKATNVKN